MMLDSFSICVGVLGLLVVLHGGGASADVDGAPDTVKPWLDESVTNYVRYTPTRNVDSGEWCHKYITGWCYPPHDEFYRANETVLTVLLTLDGPNGVALDVDFVLKHGENLSESVQLFCDAHEVAPTACAQVYGEVAKQLRVSVPGDFILFDKRDHLGGILERRGAKKGAELGVAYGHFAATTMLNWPSAEEYVLVDAWTVIDNYLDNNNADHETKYAHVLSYLEPLKARTDIVVCRNYTTVCVHDFPDEYFDYIFIDAGHDYASVYRDLVEWWPKLKKGGIFAGHDYLAQFEKPINREITKMDDWSVNYDGSVDPYGLAAKGAVNRFSLEQGLFVSVSSEAWPSWAMVKPRSKHTYFLKPN